MFDFIKKFFAAKPAAKATPVTTAPPTRFRIERNGFDEFFVVPQRKGWPDTCSGEAAYYTAKHKFAGKKYGNIVQACQAVEEYLEWLERSKRETVMYME